MLCNTHTVVQNMDECMCCSDSNCKHAIQLINALPGHTGVIMPLGAVLQQVVAIPLGLQDVKQPPRRLQY